jgi:hypothetical protein
VRYSTANMYGFAGCSALYVYVVRLSIVLCIVLQVVQRYTFMLYSTMYSFASCSALYVYVV